MARSGKHTGKKKGRIFLVVVLFICLAALCTYGGATAGEYLAQKLEKPSVENKSALNGVKSSGKTGTSSALSEDKIVSLTSQVNEFINAEHRKKNDRLVMLVDADYYNSFLKKMKYLSVGEAIVQDIDYQDITSSLVKVQVTYIKNSKNGSETITFKNEDGSWKVIKVER